MSPPTCERAVLSLCATTAVDTWEIRNVPSSIYSRLRRYFFLRQDRSIASADERSPLLVVGLSLFLFLTFFCLFAQTAATTKSTFPVSKQQQQSVPSRIVVIWRA